MVGGQQEGGRDDVADMGGSKLEGVWGVGGSPSNHQVALGCPPYGSQLNLWGGDVVKSLINSSAEISRFYPILLIDAKRGQVYHEAGVWGSGTGNCRVGASGGFGSGAQGT